MRCPASAPGAQQQGPWPSRGGPREDRETKHPENSSIGGADASVDQGKAGCNTCRRGLELSVHSCKATQRQASQMWSTKVFRRALRWDCPNSALPIDADSKMQDTTVLHHLRLLCFPLAPCCSRTVRGGLRGRALRGGMEGAHHRHLKPKLQGEQGWGSNTRVAKRLQCAIKIDRN